MVNWGELVIAAAVVVEKFERRIAVGAKKDRRRPRMSIGSVDKNLCGGARRRSAVAVERSGRLVSTLEFDGAQSKSNQVSGRRWNESQVPVVSRSTGRPTCTVVPVDDVSLIYFRNS